GADRGVARTAAAAGALALAFSRTFWSQGTAAEVYALHLVLIAVILLLFFPPRVGASSFGFPHPAGGRLLLFGYMLGLSFANHMLTVLLAPALLYAWFRRRISSRAAWAPIPRAVP